MLSSREAIGSQRHYLVACRRGPAFLLSELSEDGVEGYG